MIRLIERVAHRAKVLRCKNLGLITDSLRGRKALEIGGPSQVFTRQGLIPIYPVLGSLETSNFSDQNIWSKDAVDYVHDATQLNSIEDARFDVVLASHVFEHIANPIKALQEWSRVLRPGGFLLLLLPDKQYTFDHQRPYTTLAHLREDFERDVQDDDLTHLEEILALHDLEMDLPAGNPAQFKERSLLNFENRCLHHHVFDPALVPPLLATASFELLSQSLEFPCHIVAFARRPG